MQPSNAALREQVTELYFPGGHSGVGGGSAAEVPLAENALHFVIHEMGRRNLKPGFSLPLLSAEDMCGQFALWMIVICKVSPPGFRCNPIGVLPLYAIWSMFSFKLTSAFSNQGD